MNSRECVFAMMNHQAVAAAACHEAAGERYIVGAGCELPRDTPVENMFAVRDYVLEHQPACPHP